MVIGRKQGDQGDHEAGQSQGQPWPGSNPGDRGSSDAAAEPVLPPSLAQIQERARATPRPGGVRHPKQYMRTTKVRVGVLPGNMHETPRKHTRSGVQNRPRPDTRGRPTRALPQPPHSSTPFTRNGVAGCVTVRAANEAEALRQQAAL